MMKYILSVSIILFIIPAISSCGKRPSYVLPKDKMVNVLYDVQLAQAITEGSYSGIEKSDEKERIMKGIYEKHKITEAILDSSIMWYSDNLKLYTEINDSVLSRFSKKQTGLRNEELALSGRTGEDGLLPSHFDLDRSHSIYTFLFDSVRIKMMDTTSFQLAFDIQGLNINKQKIETGIYYTYRDTSVQQMLQVNSNSHYTISKPELPDSLLTQIRGYMRLRESDNLSIAPVMVYNIQYQDTTSIIHSDVAITEDKPATNN